MNIYTQNIFIRLGFFALALFIGNGFLVEQAHAQTAPIGGTVQRATLSEFKQDVEKGVQEVKNNKEAQTNQQEIDNEDIEQAGDNHGDTKEIDGENDQSEIDTEIEIENETETEIQQGNDKSPQTEPESKNTSTSKRDNNEGN